jgi:nicotinamidase-related amidase
MTRRIIVNSSSNTKYGTVFEETFWDATETSAIICDMWNNTECKSSTDRIYEMAPRMNEVIKKLRNVGVLIIHCPSATMDFYKDTLQRKLAQSAPKIEIKIPIQNWCNLDPKKEADLPIDDSDGCDCESRCNLNPVQSPWSRQIETIEIYDGDAITDNVEVFYLLERYSIKNVVILGVHVNMCVLGRSFGIRQMVNQGQNVILMRDMTDSVYSPRKSPYVDHFTGTDLVIWHIEKYWCPTITSNQIIGGEPFRFIGDKRKKLPKFDDFVIESYKIGTRQ